MSSPSEEFMISREDHFDGSSSLEDSLTAKLDNMLHSSDDIVVENADFFKASSNEMTEVEEVGDLPQSDNYSVPKLDLDEHGRIKYKSSESYTSLGTVVRHETPKIGQKKIKVLRNSRPQSAKPRTSSNRPKANKSSKDLVTCFRKIALKHPEYLKLMRKEKYDIEQYFYVKVKEFRELLQDRKSEEVNAKKEKLKIANKQQERKREEIRVRLEEEELERIRKSNMKYEENCRNKLKDIVESTFSKYKTIKAVEDNKYFKEISQKKSKQKELIKENIKNLYDDKIRMMREKMTERKLYQRVFEMEHKAACSEAQKSRRTQCKLLHENNKRLLQKQSELIELEAKEEVETIFKKILQFYKKSAPSRGQKS